MDLQGAKTQNERQEDQGFKEQLGGRSPLALYLSLVLLAFLLALGSLAIHQVIP